MVIEIGLECLFAMHGRATQVVHVREGRSTINLMGGLSNGRENQFIFQMNRQQMSPILIMFYSFVLPVHIPHEWAAYDTYIDHVLSFYVAKM